MITSDQPFVYRGCSFICSVEQTGSAAFQPHVLYRHGLQNLEQFTLPDDTAPYATAVEAERHAEEQAMRWVHDRTSDGRGQF